MSGTTWALTIAGVFLVSLGVGLVAGRFIAALNDLDTPPPTDWDRGLRLINEHKDDQ